MSFSGKISESPKCLKILIVEKDPKRFEVYLDLIRQTENSPESLSYEVLRESGLEPFLAGTEFLERMERIQPQLILLSGLDAPLELLVRIKKVMPSASVVILSASETIEEAVEAMRCGAEDYLGLPFKVECFQNSIRKGLSRNTLQKNQLLYLDETTGLFNVRYLNDFLEQEMDRARRTDQSFAVLFIDIDEFKSINDRYGHIAGNRILNELGEHLKNYVRERDRVFRYGGDEFVTVLSPCDLQTAEQVAERIRQSFGWHTFSPKGGVAIHCTVSIGVALFPDHASSKTDLVEAADLAMYVAKKAHKNGIEIAHLRSVKTGLSVEGLTFGIG